jgi:hypothetical protein
MTEKPDLDLVFPDWNIPDLPPPRLSNEDYVLFVNDNARLLHENHLWEVVIKNRARPVDAAFSLD